MLSFRTQARILARQFKELPEKESRKWGKKAEEDKMRYQEEMKHYVPAEDPTGGTGKKSKKKKDPNAPKRVSSQQLSFSASPLSLLFIIMLTVNFSLTSRNVRRI